MTQPFYTGETYEARCARLARRPDEDYAAWLGRMSQETRDWATGYMTHAQTQDYVARVVEDSK